jgi:predicted MFS family arabinose efflux permease
MAGLLGMAELASMSLTSILLAPVMSRVALDKVALVGLILVVAGELATAVLGNLGAVSVTRVLTGIGSGAVIAATTTSVSISPSPDRIMGLGLTVTNVLALLVYLVVPGVLERFGYRGLFVGAAVCVAVSGFAVRYLGTSSPPGGSQHDATLPKVQVDRRTVAFLAVGLLLFNVAQGSTWGFAERIGTSIGLSAQRIGQVLSACPIAMSAGSAAAGLIGQRLGYRWPLFIGTVVCGVACYYTAVATNIATYASGLFVFNFSALMLFPYATVGVPSTLDPTGRLATAATGFAWLAYSCGVTTGGLVADYASIHAIGTLALGVCIVAAVAFAYVAGPRQQATLAASVS